MTRIDLLSAKMFFNIFVHNPDPLVYDFIKKYFPGFTQKYEPGKWTVYPHGFDNMPKPYSTIHSLEFTLHPVFKAKFLKGRLDILAQEWPDGTGGIQDFQLWFMFETKKDADRGFLELKNRFEPHSKSKRIYKKGENKVAEYSAHPVLTEDTGRIQFILTKDGLYEGKYKILFRDGAFTYAE